MASIRVRNVYYMLAYAYQSLNEDGFRSVASEDFDNIHDLLAAILLKGVANQIKRGMHRDYIPQREALRRLVGKIDLTASVKQQTMMTKQMVCQYDIFANDTRLNQILKCAMMLLLRHGDVKAENKRTLRKLLLYFAGVSNIDPQDLNWRGVRYDRNNASYKLLINLCWLVIKGLLLTTEDGAYRLAAFLDDQQMHHLYERFVLGYFRKEYPQYAATASHIDWDIDDEDSRQLLPAMKSDITLTHGDRTLVIDTKYYGRTTQTNSMFNKTTLISGNLYQIYTYVKNKDRLRTGNVSGVLLYAKTDEEIVPDNDYNMGGNHIGARTLDLGAEWSEIVEQLNTLCIYLAVDSG